MNPFSRQYGLGVKVCSPETTWDKTNHPPFSTDPIKTDFEPSVETEASFMTNARLKEIPITILYTGLQLFIIDHNIFYENSSNEVSVRLLLKQHQNGRCSLKHTGINIYRCYVSLISAIHKWIANTNIWHICFSCDGLRCYHYWNTKYKSIFWVFAAIE